MLCSLCQNGIPLRKTYKCLGCGHYFCAHTWANHCTNGVCRACHEKHCSPGGSTGPGHVFKWKEGA